MNQKIVSRRQIIERVGAVVAGTVAGSTLASGQAASAPAYMGMCGKSNLKMLDRTLVKVHGSMPAQAPTALAATSPERLY